MQGYVPVFFIYIGQKLFGKLKYFKGSTIKNFKMHIISFKTESLFAGRFIHKDFL